MPLHTYGHLDLLGQKYDRTDETDSKAAGIMSMGQIRAFSFCRAFVAIVVARSGLLLGMVWSIVTALFATLRH